MSLLKLRNGNIRKYSKLGGYPIFYIHMKTNTVVCPSCAGLTVKDEEEDAEDFTPEVNYENEHLYCDQCGDQIESAYGD